MQLNKSMLSFLWRRRDLGSKILVVDSLYLTNYSPWTVRFRWPVNLGVTWWPGVTGTYRLVITPVVVDRSNPNHRWPGVSPGIICYLFTNLGRMEGCVSPAAPGYKKICWYDLHGNQARAAPIVAQWFTHYATAVALRSVFISGV